MILYIYGSLMGSAAESVIPGMNFSGQQLIMRQIKGTKNDS
jgi:hypothetical protein